MKRSTDRILTTHAGSLPRPEHIVRLMFDVADGKQVDEERVRTSVREAVADAVSRQRSVGVDVMSDGEMGKIGFATYPVQRFSGFDRAGSRAPMRITDLEDAPSLAAEIFAAEGTIRMGAPTVDGPLKVADRSVLDREIDDLLSALPDDSADSAFISAVTPGLFVSYFPNSYYRREQDYLEAAAAALSEEYRAIIASGLNLQLDSPNIAARQISLSSGEPADPAKRAEAGTDALNAALSGLPPKRIRMHVCWGNYDGPHHNDPELRSVLKPILRTNVGFISVEAANPRHEHEWRVWQDVALPDDKALIPGVIDTNTNRVEHPELVAERIMRFASCVGRERVVAGTDCGFETFAGVSACNPEVAWLKLRSLVEGAALASERLW